MSLVTEVLLVSGVALDLVGAGVLSHAHNAESIVELREDIGEEGSAVGEDDALSTHAQLLAEKRIGFFLLTLGLVLYLTGLVTKSPEGVPTMGIIAGGVVLASLAISMIFTRVVGNRILHQARQAKEDQDPDALLAIFEDRYVALHGNAHREALLRTRLDKLRTPASPESR